MDTPAFREVFDTPEQAALAVAISAVANARVPSQPAITLAYNTLQQAIQNDPELAWSWQCNIAMPIFDAGVSHKLAHVAAARVMQSLFNVDMTKHEYYFANQPNKGEPNV